MRTFGDWNDAPPGFFEVDMVEHCGGSKTDGNFVHTLVLTDIASAWTECVAMPMRNQSLIAEGFDAAASTDFRSSCSASTQTTSSAFINQTIADYCKDRPDPNAFQPYRKNASLG